MTKSDFILNPRRRLIVLAVGGLFLLVSYVSIWYFQSAKLIREDGLVPHLISEGNQESQLVEVLLPGTVLVVAGENIKLNGSLQKTRIAISRSITNTVSFQNGAAFIVESKDLEKITNFAPQSAKLNHAYEFRYLDNHSDFLNPVEIDFLDGAVSFAINLGINDPGGRFQIDFVKGKQVLLGQYVAVFVVTETDLAQAREQLQR